MVVDLLGIAESCYEHQQNTNNPDIHGEFLNELIQQFVDQTHTQKETAEQEMKDYLEGRNNWGFEVVRAAGQSQEPEKENGLPSEAVNNYYLGNILKKLFTKYFAGKEGSVEGE